MNKRKLTILIAIAAMLTFLGCGGAATTEQANTNSAGAAATPAAGDNAAGASNVPATTAGGAANNVVSANNAAAPTAPATGGVAVSPPQPGASTRDGARDGNNNNAPPPRQQASLPKPQIGSGGNDFSLFTLARGAINSDAELSAANLVVEVKDGVLTLGGTVASAAQKLKAEQLVRSVGGVKDVKNQLRVAAGK